MAPPVLHNRTFTLNQPLGLTHLVKLLGCCLQEQQAGAVPDLIFVPNLLPPSTGLTR